MSTETKKAPPLAVPVNLHSLAQRVTALEELLEPLRKDLERRAQFEQKKALEQK